MEGRSIERRAPILGRVGILAATVLAASCAGEPPPRQPVDGAVPPPLPADAAVPGDFAVRGTATGVLGPVALELRSDHDAERLDVRQDGTFAFATRLETGASYIVALVAPGTPCTLRNQTGVIANADAAIELTCTGASLASVVVSGIAPAVTLVPGTTEYVVDLPLLQQSVTLTATVTIAGDTLAVAGMPVASGMPSAEITLKLGDNLVDIVVENDLGWQRTYRLTLRRAAQLAQYAYAKASNTGEKDYFGWSVALSGDILAVGAPFEDSAAQGVGGNQDDNSADLSGAVYVFRRTGTAWQQEAYLKASNTGAGDFFGWSMALSGDTLAIGADFEASAAQGVGGNQDDNSVPYSGAVYVFRRMGTAWQQEAYLKASNTGEGDRFGFSVALSGNTLAVGALHEDSAALGVGGNQNDESATDSGAVYVFHRTGTAWHQEAYLKASNTGAGDEFGWSVALSGGTLAVGAYHEDSAVQGVGGNQDDNGAENSGAVYVFRRTGTAWQQEVYLKASNTGAGDHFGEAVELSGDTLAVGAPGSGAVYVFRPCTRLEQPCSARGRRSACGDSRDDGIARCLRAFDQILPHQSRGKGYEWCHVDW